MRNMNCTRSRLIISLVFFPELRSISQKMNIEYRIRNNECRRITKLIPMKSNYQNTIGDMKI